MTTDAVRAMIREVLAEELSRIARERAPSSQTEEIVSVNSDEELQSLVLHILKLSRDKTMRDKIIKGEHVFRLCNNSSQSKALPSIKKETTSQQGLDDAVQIEDGFLSERRVEALPPGTRIIRLGPGVRFTPLARDRLRRRKIAVERI